MKKLLLVLIGCFSLASVAQSDNHRKIQISEHKSIVFKHTIGFTETQQKTFNEIQSTYKNSWALKTNDDWQIAFNDALKGKVSIYFSFAGRKIELFECHSSNVLDENRQFDHLKVYWNNKNHKSNVKNGNGDYFAVSMMGDGSIMGFMQFDHKHYFIQSIDKSMCVISEIK